MIPEAFSAFLGPKGENYPLFAELLQKVTGHHYDLRKSYSPQDESVYTDTFDDALIRRELDAFLERVSKNVPYFHPRYSAQMLKDPAITVPLGYLAFMLSNPNNHAYEGGPVTTEMEMEVTELMKKMCGFETGWGHLCSGGSLANMEALWAVRDTYDKKGLVLFSEASHYSWKRICGILAMPGYAEIPVDKNFRMDLDILEDRLKNDPVLCVVANIGSTGTGSIDDIPAIVYLRDKYGFHLHLDAAYGGFFRSMLLDDIYNVKPYEQVSGLGEYQYRALEAMKHADSITIDPHKQGAIAYGAGAVLFKEEKFRNAILNSAPYTYHLTDKPNIGMFSLEGSRPGAMAAACYLTYRVLPPHSAGLGDLLGSTIQTAGEFYKRIESSDKYENLCPPDLDICCFYKKGETVPDINDKTLHVYHENSLESPASEFILSKFIASPGATARIFGGKAVPEGVMLTALRSVFMKHWYSLNDFYYINELLKKLESYD